MVIACYLLTKNNGNSPLPFLVVITLLFTSIIFINNCICILTGSPVKYFHDRICYTKIGGNENYPSYLNIMVNYHYHHDNWIITL